MDSYRKHNELLETQLLVPSSDPNSFLLPSRDGLQPSSFSFLVAMASTLIASGYLVAMASNILAMPPT